MIKSATDVRPTDPATDRQREVLAAMIAERDTDITVPDRLTVAEASTLIDRLKTIAKTPRDPVGAGHYVHADTLYRVRVSRYGNTYAERFVVGDGRRTVTGWELAGGWQYRLTSHDAIDKADAEAAVKAAYQSIKSAKGA